MDVVLRITRPRRLDTAVEVAPGTRISVPQFVLGILEHLAILLSGGLESDFIHHLGKGHLNVEVVLVDPVLESLGRPVEILVQVSLDDFAVRTELCRGAVGNADHLSSPATADLVLQNGSGDVARCPVLGINKSRG